MLLPNRHCEMNPLVTWSVQRSYQTSSPKGNLIQPTIQVWEMNKLGIMWIHFWNMASKLFPQKNHCSGLLLCERRKRFSFSFLPVTHNIVLCNGVICFLLPAQWSLSFIFLPIQYSVCSKIFFSLA